MNTRDHEIYDAHLNEAIKKVRQSDDMLTILQTVFNASVDKRAGSSAISVGLNKLFSLTPPIVSAWHRPSNNSPCSKCNNVNASDILVKATYTGDFGHISEHIIFNEVVKSMFKARLNGVDFKTNTVTVPKVNTVGLVSVLGNIAVLTKPIGFRRPKNQSLKTSKEVMNYASPSNLLKGDNKFFFSEVGKFVTSCMDKCVDSANGDALVITTTGTTFHVSVMTREDFFTSKEIKQIEKKLGIKIDVATDFTKSTGMYKYTDIPFFNFVVDPKKSEMFEYMVNLMVAFESKSADWYKFLNLYKASILKAL